MDWAKETGVRITEASLDLPSMRATIGTGQRPPPHLQFTVTRPEVLVS